MKPKKYFLYRGIRHLVKCECTHSWPGLEHVRCNLGFNGCEKCGYFYWIDLVKGYSKKKRVR